MGRGTKFNRGQASDAGVLSGTTVGTHPSGSTLALGGIETDGDITCDGVDTGAGVAYKLHGSFFLWGGTTTLIDTGFTTFTSITANYFGTTWVPSIVFNDNGTTSGVSCILYETGPVVTAEICGGGGTVYWTAIGV